VPCLELTNTRTPDFETEPKSSRDQSFNPTGLVLGDKGAPVEIAQVGRHLGSVTGIVAAALAVHASGTFAQTALGVKACDPAPA
jgi:hypothetical protein